MNQFDPSYGYTLSSLLEVTPPPAPDDFCQFWQQCFDNIAKIDPDPQLIPTGKSVGEFVLFELSFQSSNNITIKGWVLTPSSLDVNRIFVVGHGYGGCDEPSAQVPLADAAYLYLCYRGLSNSRLEGIPENPNHHVLYDIDDKDKYILRGCVEDTWLAVSAAAALFPHASHRMAFMGISFSGGIGALALPWDKRIKMAHLQVPSFGDHPLRMELPTWGSANAVQNFQKSNPDVLDTLRYYDAAIAASYINVPMHIAAALADPVVAPPGQFSIYNNLRSEKELFVLEMGHTDYPDHARDQAHLLDNLKAFFTDL